MQNVSNMRKIFIAIVILLPCGIINAQTQNKGISLERNAYRPSDQIVKQQIEFVDPGMAGEGLTWDFSKKNSINDKYKVRYFCPNKTDSSHITGLEHQTQYHYDLRKDTLWMTGYNNRTTEMVFDKAEAYLRFPFHYGDSLHTSFQGTGLYCQKINLIARGETHVTIDAAGKVITPDQDTIKNVIRLHRERTYNETGIKNTRIKLDTYCWYALGYRYPIFESVRSLTFFADSITDHFETSFYYPIKDLEQIKEDLVNEEIRKSTTSDNDILIRCQSFPNPVVNEVTLDFELSKKSNVSFRICDLSGLQWISVFGKIVQEGTQQQCISMSGMPPGNYILYVKVNDFIHRMKIIKQ